MAGADDIVDERKGHRARLRKRLFEGGGEALLDHELIEYLLAVAIPRADTKALAKALMRDDYPGTPTAAMTTSARRV